MIKDFDKEHKMMSELAYKAEQSSKIDSSLFDKYQVKRGLRDLDGHGVLVGLTEIGEIQSYKTLDNKFVPIPGRLIYRGMDINDICKGFLKDDRFGFEETCYLLLFGDLPNKEKLKNFEELLSNYRNLPENFVLDMILKMPSKDVMNSLSRSVMAFHSFDNNPDDISIKNVLKQCLKMISCFPMMAIYGYQALSHFHWGNSLIIRNPRADFSIAENILYMLRHDGKFTELEAKLLDVALVLHAEHGGGNNSTFTTHVVTSSGSDTYSVMAAALASLKGPKHGGANIKVTQMIDDLKKNIKNWENDSEIEEYLIKLLNKEAFDGRGLIYGIGHAVYSISDPRALILKDQIINLVKEKGLEEEYSFYERVEKLAPNVISSYRKMYKGVSANVDFYSGLLYKMLDIPIELYTPLFAISRVVGWSAHRIEEISNNGKIIRPAYNSVASRRDYVNLKNR